MGVKTLFVFEMLFEGFASNYAPCWIDNDFVERVVGPLHLPFDKSNWLNHKMGNFLFFGRINNSYKKYFYIYVIVL